MEKQLIKKIATMSILGAAALSYIVVNMLFKSLASAFGIFQRFYSIESLNHGVPIFFAVLTFLLMQLNPKVTAWAEDVIIEVSKVVWPSRKDTVAMTIVVCVFVGVASAVLVVIDYVARNLVQFIIS